jgi:hypothetical protein
MAIISGRNGQITFGGTAIAHLKSWSVDHSVGTVDVSTMSSGASNAPYIPTQYATTYTVTGTADCLFDADVNTQTSQISNLVAGTTTAIVIYPDSGESMTISSAMITGASLSSSVDGLVELRLTFTASGGSVTQIVGT